ncbi:hypothetical protein CLF_102073 [Clonorchis sinensis]|uniref:Uncharacterized protein n=1 Tax=Clonorchis sinensis TaxID=79923 RepID=G7Y783_CLOSI|nr:hypothetical protein CLF_102073 [Clonorchis sinensis]
MPTEAHSGRYNPNIADNNITRRKPTRVIIYSRKLPMRGNFCYIALHFCGAPKFSQEPGHCKLLSSTSIRGPQQRMTSTARRGMASHPAGPDGVLNIKRISQGRRLESRKLGRNSPRRERSAPFHQKRPLRLNNFIIRGPDTQSHKFKSSALNYPTYTKLATLIVGDMGGHTSTKRGKKLRSPETKAPHNWTTSAPANEGQFSEIQSSEQKCTLRRLIRRLGVERGIRLLNLLTSGRTPLGSSPSDAPETVLKRLTTSCLSSINKLRNIKQSAYLEQPSVVALTETWLAPEVSDVEILVSGYSIFRADSKRGSVIYCCPASPPEDNQFLVQPPEQLSCSHHFKHLLLVELHRTIVQNTHDTEAIFVPRKPARSRMYPVVVSEFCRKHQVGLYSVTTTSSHTNLSRHNHEGPQTIVVFTENGNYQLLHKTNAFSAFGPGEIYSEKLHSQRRSVSALFFVIHSAKATSCDLLNGRATLCQCLASCPPSMRRSLLSEVDSLDVAVIMTLFVPCARCSIRRTVESIPNILESVSGLCVTVMVSFLPPPLLIFRIAWGNIYEPGTEHIRSFQIAEESFVDMEHADVVLIFKEEEKVPLFLSELTKVIPFFGERQPLNDKNKTDPGNLGEGLDPVYQSVKSIKIHSATRFLPNRSRVATMLVFMGNQARDMGLISDAIFFDFAKETQRTPLSCVVRMGQKTLQFGFVDLFKRPHCVKNFGSKDFRRSTYDSANIPLYYSHGLPDTLCGLCRTVS